MQPVKKMSTSIGDSSFSTAFPNSQMKIEDWKKDDPTENRNFETQSEIENDLNHNADI